MVQILSGSFFHFFFKISFVVGIILSHKLRTPTSARDNSPFINCQRFPDGSSVTSPTDASDGELQVNDDVDSGFDEEVPRKRQKTQTGITGSNARITISNVLVKSGDKKSTIVDGTPALSQNAPVKEGKQENSASTHNRKRVNGQSGLLVSRPLAMSTSTSISDSSNSGVLKDREEPPRKTRGSYGTKLKKSQGRIADQDELELWTNADVAHIRFRKPDELDLLDKMEEESTKRNLSHILTCLMEMEAMQETIGEKKTSKAQEWTKMVQNIQAGDGLKGQEDEETGDDVNSPQVPLPQLQGWSTTLRSLLKGKKKFQHQVCCDPFPLSLKLSKFTFRT
jgi:hypothetical protein